jgi:serine/threonine protein kinase
LGYYHRDLKPDNILISDNTWKIGDLGLVSRRNNEFNLDKVAALIGPRGWYSPEALNKYLTEDKNLEFSYDCM